MTLQVLPRISSSSQGVASEYSLGRLKYLTTPATIGHRKPGHCEAWRHGRHASLTPALNQDPSRHLLAKRCEAFSPEDGFPGLSEQISGKYGAGLLLHWVDTHVRTTGNP